MTVYETDVPGVGQKYEIELGGGERVIAILHHDGRREVFRRAGPDEDSERLLDLPAHQAKLLGSILEGAYFQSVDTDDLAVPLGDAIIEWTEIPEDSGVVGTTLAAANVRAETGVSVLAIQRGSDTLSNPGPDETLEAGDILVTLGTRREQSALAALVADHGD